MLSEITTETRTVMVKNYCRPLHLAAFAILLSTTQMSHAQNPNLDPLIDEASLIQDLTNSAQEVIAVLPTTDAAGVTAAAARMGAIAPQADLLRMESEATRTGLPIETMFTPAELNGLVTRVPSTALTPGTYISKERSFEEGSNVADIAAQMLWDWGLNVWDFYANWESKWKISGLCRKKTKFYPMQKYYWPAVWFEQSSDMYRGRYFEQMLIRPLYQGWIEDGTLPIIALSGLFDDRYDMAKELAPREINRIKAVAGPDENGEQKSHSSRLEALANALGSSGDIPSVHEPAYAIGESVLKELTKYGEVSARGRNVESYRFAGLSQYMNFPSALLGNFHKRTPSALPFVHRTDNPLIFPYTRNQSALDILHVLNLQITELNLGAIPGHCMQYDQLQLHGLPGAMGVVSNGNFGLLSKVHPDPASIPFLTANANNRKCLKGGGSVYPLTNFVAGGKHFKSAFYTKFLRMNKLSKLYTFNIPEMGLPMFHHHAGYGSRFASKIQIHESSFGGSDNPHFITESTLDTAWTKPNYNNKRIADGEEGGIVTGADSGLDLDIGSGVEWHRYDLCPPGYKVLWGDNPQIRGHETYRG